MAQEKKSEQVIPVVDGTEHGYFGTVMDDTPNEAYSVTGTTSAGPKDEPGSTTSKDEPKSAPKSRASTKS